MFDRNNHYKFCSNRNADILITLWSLFHSIHSFRVRLGYVGHQRFVRTGRTGRCQLPQESGHQASAGSSHHTRSHRCYARQAGRRLRCGARSERARLEGCCQSVAPAASGTWRNVHQAALLAFNAIHQVRIYRCRYAGKIYYVLYI